MSPRSPAPAVRASALAAALMIAQQMGAKATRDAFFLSEFHVSSLPWMVVGSALLSIVAVLATGGVLTRWGPRRVVRWGFAVSAVLLLGEWGLARLAPRLASVVLYVHIAAFGSLLVSWFWSLVNERFDPHTARRQMGRIQSGATLGGLAGGLLAGGLASFTSVPSLLLPLAIMHGAVVWAVGRIAPSGEGTGSQHPPASPEPRERGPLSGFRSLREMPYLRMLALLVLVGTVAAGFLDYVFKEQASARFSEERLLQFFAAFYTLINVLAFLLQSGVAGRLLKKLGLGATAAAHPLGMAVASAIGLVAPGVATVAAARGTETVLRNSLFRSSYELFYNPLPESRKRSTKSMIDVGFDRLGDALSGLLVKLVLTLGAGMARSFLLGGATILGLVGVWIALRLQRGYVGQLAKSLLDRADLLRLPSTEDSTTRVTLMQTLSGLDLDALRKSGVLQTVEGDEERPTEALSSSRLPGAGPPQDDAVIVALRELRSRDPQRVKQALAQNARLELGGQMVSLLAWDAVSEDAIAALRKLGPRMVGQLEDALCDPDEEFAVRRRIPRVLAGVTTERSARALFAGLEDRRFEVRFQCGRALARLAERKVRLPGSRPEVFELVSKELAVDPRVWGERKLLEKNASDEDSVFVDRLLSGRTNRSLEHVFTLLALVLPREPLQVAFQGLHTEDQRIRGTALEYLDTVLPPRLKNSLWPLIKGARPAKPAKPRTAPARSQKDVLSDLMLSSDSIRIELSESRKELKKGSE